MCTQVSALCLLNAMATSAATTTTTCILRRTLLLPQLTLRKGNPLLRTRAFSAAPFSSSISKAAQQPLVLSSMPQTRAQTSTIIRRTLAGDSGQQGQYVVEHDVKNHKFVIKLDPDNSAFIDYEQLNNSEVLLYHTEVPSLYAGKGIGQVLADEAFAHFERAGQKMVITCTYLQKLDKARKSN